jgi:hypothetical protein
MVRGTHYPSIVFRNWFILSESGSSAKKLTRVMKPDPDTNTNPTREPTVLNFTEVCVKWRIWMTLLEKYGTYIRSNFDVFVF